MVVIGSYLLLFGKKKWEIEIKTVYKIVKYKTNYLYFIGDYIVIKLITEAALS